ncbi:hypothetical protein VSP10_07025 [Myroides odoratimimus]|uniref:Uncharacterized protein n=2 Tax=Myroides odoratimimus TaxID=76832 RepID=A0AAV3F6B3_9FLAO|nr:MULTISPECIES: hypothetical protein [Myroides]EHO14622.1 hypothetical protein HMPREF9715_00507 [Myroides odoratimimus CIP 101113]EPH09915.1 hypothetical protein HMPREF9713_02576 [Myroides odoratimimus CCUG 12700]MDM1395662.1 hypothetical protein [Myroides odoratimimus]MDM1529791.1 hypothetical protein [Myroides odoratimimus]MEC4052542.1 hypothetical protein [Myroides odoratimimus]
MKRSKGLLIVGLLMISIGTSLVAMQNFGIGLFLLISAVVVLLFALVIGAKEKRASKN